MNKGLMALTLPEDVRDAIADWRQWLSGERRAAFGERRVTAGGMGIG